MRGTVFISGQYKGQFEIDKRQVHGQWMNVEGIAYFCPECSDIWARILIQGRPSQVISVPCRLHHRWLHWPGGTIWLSWEKELMAALPREVLEVEALRACDLVDQHEESFRGNVA